MTSSGDPHPATRFWVAPVSRFGPRDYSANGSPDPKGGAHFFYGNLFTLKSGKYIFNITLHNPQSIASPRLVIEAMTWRGEQSVCLASASFSVDPAVDEVLVVFTVNPDERSEIEIRGWSDAHPDALRFAGVVVDQINDEPLFGRQRSVGWEVPAAAQSPAGPVSVTVTDNQLLFVGPAKPKALSLTIPTRGRAKTCAVILPDDGLLLESYTGYAQLFDLLDPPFDPKALTFDVDGQGKRPVDICPLQTIEHGTLHPPGEAYGHTVQLERTMEARLEALSVALRSEFDDALVELANFKQQIPRLLNAVSAANAAASIVGKSQRATGADAADLAREVRALREQVSLLWKVVEARTATDPQVSGASGVDVTAHSARPSSNGSIAHTNLAGNVTTLIPGAERQSRLSDPP